MKNNRSKPNKRLMIKGEWYWSSKFVIQNYTKKVGFLAMCVYQLMASMVNEKQVCFPSQKYIAECLGCSRASVNKAIKILEKNKLIRVWKRCRYNCEYLLLDIPKCKAGETQMSTTVNSDVKHTDTNNNKLTRIINNNSNASNKFINKPMTNNKTREELLVNEIASTLNDYTHDRLILKLCNKYSEQLIRQVLEEVEKVPEHRIKKSRLALFTYLLKKYDY